jgi:hypothetical protein
MQMPRKPSDPVKLNLRFTEALRSRLEKAATKNNRSLNEEIVRRVEESFREADMMIALEKLSERMSERMIKNVTVKLGGVVLRDGKWVRDEDKS